MGIPAYSEGALQARDILFANVAKVHFFVEDQDQESLYAELIERMFPRLTSFQVFPLAGKRNVLSHAQSEPEAGLSAVRVYILDKDFDDILERQVALDGVFYLDDYNLEQSVVDDYSLIRICVEERPRLRRAEIRERLAIDDARTAWLPLLDKLHRAFALVQKYDLGIANTDLPPERFCKVGDPSSLDARLVESYVDQVVHALVERGVIDSETAYAEASRRVFGSARLQLKHINGKFLSRLYFHRMKRRRLVSNLTQDSMLMRCAGASELKRLRGLKARVGRFISQRLRT